MCTRWSRGQPQYATLKFGPYAAELGPAEIKWTRYTSPQQFLARGDLVYVKVLELNGTQSRVSLEQESGVQGALLALDNSTGDIKAMVGGRNFERVEVQSRHPGVAAGGIVVQALHLHRRDRSGHDARRHRARRARQLSRRVRRPYSPHNYDGKFEGIITFRHALARLAQHSGAEGDASK